jgi:hypothetical protein
MIHPPRTAARSRLWSRWLVLPALLAVFVFLPVSLAQPPAKQEPLSPEAQKAQLDQKIIAEAKSGSDIMANLTYLSDVIGPRLTGSAALKKANDWTAEKMKKYGLKKVHLEAWTMPEGWERGIAVGRVIEPNNGRTLTLASMGWTPGTKGKIQGDVVFIKAEKVADLDAYKGKLKGAIILRGPPAKLTPWNEIEKPGESLFGPTFRPGDKGKISREEQRAIFQAQAELLRKEGIAAILTDAGKHFNLLMTTGSWGGGFGGGGKDRPSAASKVPTLSVAHEHYAMLYRLATRPGKEKTRIELEVTNKFIPGPIAVSNTIGEIPGSEKPDEYVIVGAHLDSWDLGQGSLDNGTGSSVVLETARILAKCGVAPKRTIRFILFTGEEQGLHGSRAYVKQHKDEMAKTMAAIVHDTGTGKVIGLGWMGKRDSLKEILEGELGALKDLGVQDLNARGFGGSDHMSFSSAGVPACIFRQEIAGYRFAHHSQADTLELAREADLIQGAQVMAVTAMRLANMEKLLPREEGGKKKAGADTQK